MSQGTCPSCGQPAVTSTEPGRGQCGACGARFFKYPEILPALAKLGVGADTIQQQVASASHASFADPSTGARLKSIALGGMALHLSPQGQAIWVSAQDAQRLGLAAAPSAQPKPARPTLPHADFSGPSSGEDVMAALGLGGPAPAPDPAGPGLDLAADRRARPAAPSLDDERAAMFRDLPPPPGPGIDTSVPITSESAFAVKPKRVSAGGLFGLLIKLGLLAALVGGGWWGYQEFQRRFMWRDVALAWGYAAGFPQHPRPVADTLETSQGQWESITWTGEDGLELIAMWADIGFGQEQAAKQVIPEVAGRGFNLEAVGAGEGGLKVMPFSTPSGGEPPVGRGRAYFDDNGRVVILIARGPSPGVVNKGGGERFPVGLVRAQRAPAATE